MKVHEVPQELDPSLESVRKVCYALDEQGKFVMTQSLGWDVEGTVQGLAWQVIEEDLEATRLEVGAGRLSPLGYFMKLRQMDIKLLSQNMGVSVFRIRWHLRPAPFGRLDETWLRRYSDCLEIPLERLRGGRL